MTISAYHQLNVWHKSFTFAKDTYGFCDKSPYRERHGLINQMQLTSTSIPSNTAEIQQQTNRNEDRQFIGMIKGLAAEREAQLSMFDGIYDIEGHQIRITLKSIQKMLHSPSTHLNAKPITINQ